jgi:hypothetical protein
MSQPTATDGNASTQTVTTPPANPAITADLIPTISADLIKSHPTVKELETKLAATEQDAKTWKGRLEKANESLNPKETKPEEKKTEPQFVTREELWERDNSKKIILAGDDYKQNLTQGMKPEVALEYALLKKGITAQNIGEHLRQAETSSAPSTVDRSGSIDQRTPDQKAADAKMGITAEDRAKYGERAKNMTTYVRG